MKRVITISILLILASCSSNKPRTKWTDKNMRVMIDPMSLESVDYVRLQAALVTSKKWAVIDRAKAFSAIKKEQEMLHRKNVDRFDDKQKWAQWGKLYGIGGVIVANVKCHRVRSFWNSGRLVSSCNQFLSIVDANTAEVITAIEDEQKIDINSRPSWTEIVEKFNDSYPDDYKPKIYNEGIEEYKAVSEEEAIRQKEEKAAIENNGNN